VLRLSEKAVKHADRGYSRSGNFKLVIIFFGGRGIGGVGWDIIGVGVKSCIIIFLLLGGHFLFSC